MTDRPTCYPAAEATLRSGRDLPRLDVLTSPVPAGVFDSPVDTRHVLCLHLGPPVPVSYRAERSERDGVRLHGQFCVVPAGSSTRWTLSRPARSLLLRLEPSLLDQVAKEMGRPAGGLELQARIHMRDPQVERIGWMMQAEDRDAYPGGRLFADSLAAALAARLLALQLRRPVADATAGRALPPRRFRRVVEHIDAHLDQDLTLAELAAVAGYSLSHFKSLFRQAAGMPAHRFVLERRVERARTLLLSGKRSVMDVAVDVGFAHASHLARCMRHQLGVSPSELSGVAESLVEDTITRP